MANTVYNQAVETGMGSIGSFDFITVNDSFIQFFSKSYRVKNLTGWKTHLSVAEADIERATDCVFNVMQEHAGTAFKVTTPRLSAKFSDPNLSGAQAGKIFTLYDTGTEDWPQIIQEIESRFDEANISSGPVVTEDEPVVGSRYSSRRNDHWPNGRYIPAHVARQINPDNPSNPFDKPDQLVGFQVHHAEKRQALPQTPQHSLDSVVVFEDLRALMGKGVLGVTSQKDAKGAIEYVVTLSNEAATSDFGKAGIDGNHLAISSFMRFSYDVIVPPAELPKSTQEDAAFFYNIQAFGLPARTVHRIGKLEATEAYVVEVPASYSRTSFSFLGLDATQIARRASTSPSFHEVEIPRWAAHAAGLTSFGPMPYADRNEPVAPSPLRPGSVPRHALRAAPQPAPRS